MFNLYKMLWSRIGRRPWTHIISDAADDHTLLFLAGTFFLGDLLGDYWATKEWAVFVGGILAGHFWWPWCVHAARRLRQSQLRRYRSNS